LTCEPKDLVFASPVRAGRTQPENIFRRIENLRAETHRPN